MAIVPEPVITKGEPVSVPNNCFDKTSNLLKSSVNSSLKCPIWLLLITFLTLESTTVGPGTIRNESYGSRLSSLDTLFTVQMLFKNCWKN